MRGKVYTGNKRIRNRHSSKAIRVLGRVSAVVLLSVSLLLSNAETCLAANIGTGNSIQEEESDGGKLPAEILSVKIRLQRWKLLHRRIW